MLCKELEIQENLISMKNHLFYQQMCFVLEC